MTYKDWCTEVCLLMALDEIADYIESYAAALFKVGYSPSTAARKLRDYLNAV